ncbi:MAG: hypothetical protein KY468_06745 [Armatimonadetes bacterium]|nr:hypothetical protein [Armatimonadota bacterium]
MKETNRREPGTAEEFSGEQGASGIVEKRGAPGDPHKEETSSGGVGSFPGQPQNPGGYIPDGQVPVQGSNTTNTFEEEHTEGFDIAPTGSGDLEEKV